MQYGGRIDPLFYVFILPIIVLLVIGAIIIIFKKPQKYAVIVYKTEQLGDESALSPDQRRILTSSRAYVSKKIGCKIYRVDADVLTDRELCRKNIWGRYVDGCNYRLPVLLIHKGSGKFTVIELPKTEQEILEAARLELAGD